MTTETTETTKGPSKRWMVLWAAEATAGLFAVAATLILMAAVREHTHWQGLEVAAGLGLSFLGAALAGPLIAAFTWLLPWWARIPAAATAALSWFFAFSRVFFHFETSGFTLGFELLFAVASGSLLAAMPAAVYAGLRPRGLLPTLAAAVLATGVGFGIVAFGVSGFLVWVLFNLA